MFVRGKRGDEPSLHLPWCLPFVCFLGYFKTNLRYAFSFVNISQCVSKIEPTILILLQLLFYTSCSSKIFFFFYSYLWLLCGFNLIGLGSLVRDWLTVQPTWRESFSSPADYINSPLVISETCLNSGVSAQCLAINTFLLTVILQVNTWLLPKPRLYFRFIYLRRIKAVPLVKRSLFIPWAMLKFLISRPEKCVVSTVSCWQPQDGFANITCL